MPGDMDGRPMDIVASDGNTMLYANTVFYGSGNGNGMWVDSTDAIFTIGRPVNEFRITKTYHNGTQAWNVTWKGGQYNYPTGIWGDGAGHVYTCGYTRNDSMRSERLVLIKWNSSGGLVWNRTYNDSEDNELSGISGDKTGIYTAGSRNGHNVFLVKWTFDGDINWTREWGSGSPESATCVWCTGYGNIYVAGWEQWFGAGSYDIVLFKWNHVGNLIWNKTWGTANIDTASCVWGDGTYVYTGGVSGPYSNATLIKWDALGGIVSQNTYSWNTAIASISGAGAGYLYATTGSTLVKLATNGTVMWDSLHHSPPFCPPVVWGNETFAYTYGGKIVRWGTEPAPAISSPGNITYVYGEPKNITWVITGAGSIGSSFPRATYEIYLDGGRVCEKNSWWSGVPVVIDWQLTPGSHTCKIVATDLLGTVINDTVFVTVGNVAPVLSGPPDATYYVRDVYLRWNITDTSVSSGTWIAYQNGSTYWTGTWSFYTQYARLNCWYLLPGIYNFTIVVNDGYGGTGEDTVMITIVNEAPVIIGPTAESSSIVGARGYSITWTIDDQQWETRDYTILRNGTVVATGYWDYGTVAISLDGLGVGRYNFTIIVDDGLGGQARHTAFHTVREKPAEVPGYSPIVLVSIGMVVIAVLIIKTRRKECPNSLRWHTSTSIQPTMT